MIIAIWIVTVLFIGLWSLAAWGVGSLLTMDGAWVTKIEPWLQRLPFGGWLETWFPDWLQVTRWLLEGLQGVLAWLGDAAPVLMWALWGMGTLVLLLLALGLSLLVALIRRSTPAPAQPQPPVAPA